MALELQTRKVAADPMVNHRSPWVILVMIFGVTLLTWPAINSRSNITFERTEFTVGRLRVYELRMLRKCISDDESQVVLPVGLWEFGGCAFLRLGVCTQIPIPRSQASSTSST